MQIQYKYLSIGYFTIFLCTLNGCNSNKKNGNVKINTINNIKVKSDTNEVHNNKSTQDKSSEKIFLNNTAISNSDFKLTIKSLFSKEEVEFPDKLFNKPVFKQSL